MKSRKSPLSRDMALMSAVFGVAGAVAIPESVVLATVFALAAALTMLLSVLLGGQP